MIKSSFSNRVFQFKACIRIVCGAMYRSRRSKLPLLRVLISDLVSDLKGSQQTYTLRFSHSLSEPALCLTRCIVDRASSSPPVSALTHVCPFPSVLRA